MDWGSAGARPPTPARRPSGHSPALPRRTPATAMSPQERKGDHLAAPHPRTQAVPFPGRALLAGETGPEARRSHRRRRARRVSPLLVELGEVAGERHVLEAPRRRTPAYARRVFGLTEASTSRRAAGAGPSPPQAFDPRVRDPHLEAVDAGLEWAVRRVIQTMRASMRRSPRAAGVFSAMRQMTSSSSRNQTWSPSGSSSAPNQQVRPLGSRLGGRAIRIRGPPGQSPRHPSMTDRELAVGHGGPGSAPPARIGRA